MKPSDALNTSNKSGKSVLGIVAALGILSISGFDLGNLTRDLTPAGETEDFQAAMDALDERIKVLEDELHGGVEK